MIPAAAQQKRRMKSFIFYHFVHTHTRKLFRDILLVEVGAPCSRPLSLAATIRLVSISLVPLALTPYSAFDLPPSPSSFVRFFFFRILGSVLLFFRALSLSPDTTIIITELIQSRITVEMVTILG